jgi:hypothetical protein
MNQPEQSVFPVVVYGGSTAASMSGGENSSACPDSLASIFRDAVVVYDIQAIEIPSEARGQVNTALQPTGSQAPTAERHLSAPEPTESALNVNDGIS